MDHAEDYTDRQGRGSCSDEVATARSSSWCNTPESGRLSHLAELLEVWRHNRRNGNEEFWQQLIGSHPELLFYVLRGRAYTIRGKCYVGGKGLDNTGGMIADFIAQGLSNAVVIEIKTPVTKLVRLYRKTAWALASDLSGAWAQVLQCRNNLKRNIMTLKQNNLTLEAPSPLCLVLAGDKAQLSSPEQLRSFEVCRNAFKDIEFITYDELFEGIESMLTMLPGLTPEL